MHEFRKKRGSWRPYWTAQWKYSRPRRITCFWKPSPRYWAIYLYSCHTNPNLQCWVYYSIYPACACAARVKWSVLSVCLCHHLVRFRVVGISVSCMYGFYVEICEKKTDLPLPLAGQNCYKSQLCILQTTPTWPSITYPAMHTGIKSDKQHPGFSLWDTPTKASDTPCRNISYPYNKQDCTEVCIPI